jgi:NAD+ diphosphatase
VSPDLGPSSIPPVSLGKAHRSRFYIFHGSQLLVRTGEVSPRAASAADLDELGVKESVRTNLARLCGIRGVAVALDRLPELPKGLELRSLRTLGNLLEATVVREARTAYHVLTWDRGSRFCGYCGGPTVLSEGEHARICTKCEMPVFPRISPATITAVTSGTQILLAHNRKAREGLYSLIAGYVEPGENLEEAVRREIREEVDIQVSRIRYFGSQHWPYPDTLMVGFTAEYRSGEIKVDGKEITDARWFDTKALPLIPTPGSISRQLIDWFVEKMKAE